MYPQSHYNSGTIYPYDAYLHTISETALDEIPVDLRLFLLNSKKFMQTLSIEIFALSSAIISTYLSIRKHNLDKAYINDLSSFALKWKGFLIDIKNFP
jgi:hypothetical protein